MVSHKVKLPTFEELDVPEVNLSISGLKAGAFHLGKYCENQNNEFMLCRDELRDPRKCLNEGKAVTACSMQFFQQVKKHCSDEFTQYANCLFRSSSEQELSKCRKTQAVFDKCILDSMGIERDTDYGYFCRIKVHHTDRPKPVNEPKVFADTPDPLPENLEKKPAQFGNRYMI